MDIFSHAIAGACTGAAWGRPLTGALVAVLPDAVLYGPRRRLPTPLYNLCHSLLFLGAATWVASFWELHWLVYFCLLSHIFLDAPTHGVTWAPPLFYPFHNTRFNIWHDEWEWGNETWLFGLLLTCLWSIAWLLASLLGTGSPS